MATTILSLKLHREYSNILSKVCSGRKDLEKQGLLYLDEFILYLNKCRQPIIDKLNCSGNKSKHFKKEIHEFTFSLIVTAKSRILMKIEVTESAIKGLSPHNQDSIFTDKPGFVYFLHSEYGYKIGMTSNINKRFKELSVLLPFKVGLHSYCETYNYVELEKNLHVAFKDQNLNGEWFTLSDEDWKVIDEIIRIHKTKRVMKSNSYKDFRNG